MEHKVKIIGKFNLQFEQDPDQMIYYDFETLFSALKYMLIQLAYILEFEERMDILELTQSPITLSSFALILKDSVSIYTALLKGFLRVLEDYKGDA